MNSDADITSGHLCWTNSQCATKPHRFRWAFFHQYLVDNGWHANYQCCGKVLSTCIKVPFASES